MRKKEENLEQTLEPAEKVPSEMTEVEEVVKKTQAREPRLRNRKRRKVSFLTIEKIDRVDYKDVQLLKRFLNDQGKILPARNTGNTAKQQRMISRAIRRAREMALLPFDGLETGGGEYSYARRSRSRARQEPREESQ